MPMMRRGPLDRYPPEWVLRQANAHQVDGSIEFHTDRPVTFFLDGGSIYAAEPGTGLANPERIDPASPDEDVARRQVVDLLQQVLRAADGWYFHDPLGHHPGRGPWVWETATLLMDTRAAAAPSAPPPPAADPLADRTVALRDTAAAPITLGPDAWALVVQLAQTSTASDLRSRLGWNPDRLLQALRELEQSGGLGPEPNWRPKPADPDLRPPAAAPLATVRPLTATPETTWSGDADHHTGPLAPPPVLAERAARRRLRPGRSASGS